MRFSVPTVIVLPALAIVTGSTLTFMGPVLASAIFTVTLVMVLGGTVAAFVRRGRSRAFWFGFSVFAGLYFALQMCVGGPWVIATLHEDDTGEPRRPCLVTSYLLAWAYDRLGGPEIRTSGGSHVPAVHLLTVQPNQIPANLDTADLEVFLSNGQCALTLLVGFLGGSFASWLHRHGCVEESGDE